MWHFGMTQSQHCSNDNDDNTMCVSMHVLWILWQVILMSKNCDKGERNVSWAHPFPRVSRYTRGSDIKEDDDIEEVRPGVIEIGSVYIGYFPFHHCFPACGLGVKNRTSLHGALSTWPIWMNDYHPPSDEVGGCPSFRWRHFTPTQ
jgi:hypothetical protein